MRSSIELRLAKYIESLGYKPLHGKQHGVELDIWVKTPDNRIVAFEVNGVRFHCSSTARRTRGITFKDKDYHRNKTIMALKSGVLLYHLWDCQPESELKLIISKALRGEVISNCNVDLNPSLVCVSHPKPFYVFDESAHFHKAGTMYYNKPLCWSTSEVQIYEIYNSGWVED